MPDMDSVKAATDRLKAARRIKDPLARFVALSAAIAETEAAIGETNAREAALAETGPRDLDIQQESVDLVHVASTLAIERARVIRTLADEGGLSYGDIATAAGERPKMTRDKQPVVGPKGEPIMAPALSRQRVHQIYMYGRSFGPSVRG